MMLLDRLGPDAVIENADMRDYTSFRAGGKAKLLVIPEDMSKLRYTLYMLGRAGDCSECGGCLSCGGCGGCEGADVVKNEDPVEYMIIGNGSNVLVRDGGFDGVIVRLGDGFDYVRAEADGTVVAGGATLLSSVAAAALKAGLTGFEFASGIPGSVGGACFMNAGAYGGEMKDVLVNVTVISKDGTIERLLPVSELELGYRTSVFEKSGDIVVKAEYRLSPGDKTEIEKKMRELRQKRNEKQPVNLPSAGSFFKRPEGHFAGALIEGAGLKGLSVGGARVSPLHAGFIVNEGGATCTDIESLMRLVQNTVEKETGVRLEPEVRIIGKGNKN
jgi:UDP-N-acetylmuramate dehydrogenase